MSRYRWVLVVGDLLVLLVGCNQSQKSAVEQNKALVASFNEACNARNFDAMREMLAPDFIRYCSARTMGTETLKNGITVEIPSGEASNARNTNPTREKQAPEFFHKWEATPYTAAQDRDMFIQYLKANAKVFPDSRQTIQNIVVEGDLVAFSVMYEGTQEGQMHEFAASHKKMRLDVIGMFRVHNGKLAELWVTWDRLEALVQLDHFPPPSVSK